MQHRRTCTGHKCVYQWGSLELQDLRLVDSLEGCECECSTEEPVTAQVCISVGVIRASGLKVSR